MTTYTYVSVSLEDEGFHLFIPDEELDETDQDMLDNWDDVSFYYNGVFRTPVTEFLDKYKEYIGVIMITSKGVRVINPYPDGKMNHDYNIISY